MSLITEVDQLDPVKQAISKAHYVVLDVETFKTETHYGKELMGVALGVPSGIDLQTWYVVPDMFKHVWQEFHDGIELIGHNLKFDLEILWENGYDFQGRIWDTQVLAHLVNENEFSYELDALANKYFKVRKIDMKLYETAFEGWNNIPPIYMGRYAEQDIVITWKLFLKNLGQIKELELEQAWRESEKYVRTLQLIVRSGIHVDRVLVADLSREAEGTIRQIESQLTCNPGSTKSVRDYLYGSGGLGLKPSRYTKKGQPATDTPALNDLMTVRKAELESDALRSLELIKEWRRVTKEKSTWFDGFLVRMGDRDYLHPGLKQHGTKTGRLSCAEPNLQQIPRGDRVKRIFLDDGDWLLVEFDYSQIELRIGSWYAMRQGDPKMFELYKAGADVHMNTAKMIGSIEATGSISEGRQVGKTGNFLWIYQGGAARLQETLWKDAQMVVNLGQCRQWTEAFHTAYPGFRKVNKQAEITHRKRGYVRFFNGRRRTIQTKDDDGRIKHHIAFNSIVQGGAGQILMTALNKLAELQRSGAPFRMCSTVHDSVWFYIHKDHMEEASELIKETMAEPPEKQFDLPFAVDMKRIGRVA